MSDPLDDVEGYLRRAVAARPGAELDGRIRELLRSNTPMTVETQPRAISNPGVSIGARGRGAVLAALAAAAFLLLLFWVLHRPSDRIATVGSQDDSEKKILALIEQLGSDSIETREKAAKELRGLGEAALGALDRAAASHSESEVRLRAKNIAERIRRRLKFGDRGDLSDEELQEKTKACGKRLSHLWTLQMVYMSQFGGRMKRMPSETGRDFWLKLTSTVPPLIDTPELEVLVCPLSGEKPREGFTTYRGPKADVATLKSDDIVGACDHGVHPDGTINVLFRNGQIRTVRSEDNEYKRCLESSKGAAAPDEDKKK